MSTDPLDELSHEEKQELVDLVRGNGSANISRRDALALGIGGLVGGSAATGVSEPATADASTSDDDGNVGLPDDRVDVYADGIDGVSISVDERSINNLWAEYGTSSSQSVANDTATDVVWDQTVRDEIGSMDGNGHWSPDTDGTYQFIPRIRVNGSSGGSGQTRLTINQDNTKRSYGTINTNEGAQDIPGGPFVLELTTSDSVPTDIRQRTGESVGIDQNDTRLEIVWLG